MIGVLAGTGVTGSQVVAALQKKGADFKCIVRNPDAARQKLGGEVALVQGDLSDRASLDAAFAGLDTLYLLCGHSPMLGEMEKNGLEAAKQAGVGYIVKSSGSEKGITPDAPSKILQMHHQMEQEVRNSGVKWAILRPNYFMSNLMAMAEPIAKAAKMITALPPATEISMIHPADIGECAAELLTDDGRAGDSYFVTGQVVSMSNVAEELSSQLGREIEYVHVTPEAAAGAMAEKGMPDWLIAHLGGIMGMAAQGGMKGTTDWVEKLAGHPPRTLGEWIGANKGAFGG